MQYFKSLQLEGFFTVELYSAVSFFSLAGRAEIAMAMRVIAAVWIDNNTAFPCMNCAG
jgi:hypothetical protein